VVRPVSPFSAKRPLTENSGAAEGVDATEQAPGSHPVVTIDSGTWD
jgi:hypothetical protein